MAKIKYNPDELRWELLSSDGSVVDYATGSENDKPWNLTWGSISISAGGSVDVTAAPGDILEGVTAVVRGSVITGDMPNNGEFVFTPTADGITEKGGYYEAIRIEGDADLISGNIKDGITIFGVTGTHKGGSNIDLSVVTATADKVLEGSKFIDSTGAIVNGNIKTVKASLTDNVVTVPKGHIATAQTLTVSEMTEPSVSGNVVTIAKGYNKSKKTVTVGTAKGATTITPGTADQTVSSGTYLTGALTVKGDTNLKSSNIKEGVTIFGVEGGLTSGGSGTPDLSNLTPANIKYGITINGVDGTYTDASSYSFPATSADMRFDRVAWVNGIEIIGTMPEIAYQYVFVTSYEMPLENGYYEGCTMILDDEKLKSSNIKYGVTIFGVEGSYTADATATAADIAQGKTAYVKGELVTGTMVPSMEDSAGSAGSGGTGESSDPYIQVSNSSITGVNGKYYREIWVDDADFNPCEDGVTAKWVSSNGYYIMESTNADCEIHYSFCNSAGVHIYALPSAMTFWARATDYNLGWYVNTTGGSVAQGGTDGVQLTIVEGDRGSGDAFYLATSYQGVVQKITLSGLLIKDDMDELYSLNGEYILLDESVKGKKRVWYCAATTPTTYNGTEYASTSEVCIGCYEVDAGWDDETGDTIYEYYWGICYGKDPSLWGTYYYCSDATLQSPMQATSWSVGERSITTVLNNATLTPSMPDVAPYGPTAWNGKEMTWSDSSEIYLTYGDDCLPSCVGYWVRQDSGDLTVNSTWVNPVSGAVIQIDSKTAGYPSWEIHAYLDYYKGVGKVYTQGNWNKEYGIQSPFSSEFNTALYSVMPQGKIYGATGTDGWQPSDTETTGLEIKKNAPELGKVYNKDATVRIGAMYPAK